MQPDVIVDVGSTSAIYVTLAQRVEARRSAGCRDGARLLRSATIASTCRPTYHSGWFDAPRSLNRLLGVQWLARLLHPTLFPEPLAPIMKAFHTRHYHLTSSDAQLRALLEGTGLPR
jgi:hypothetical protein